MPHATIASSEICRATFRTFVVVRNFGVASASRTNISTAAARMPSSRIRRTECSLPAEAAGAATGTSTEGGERTVPAIRATAFLDYGPGEQDVSPGDHAHDVFT